MDLCVQEAEGVYTWLAANSICYLEEEAVCVLASLISPKIWFMSDMQSASTLMCSQHSWVSDTKICAQTLLFHLVPVTLPDTKLGLI